MRVELLGVSAFDEKGIQTGLMPVELIDTFWPKIEEMLDRLPHTWKGYSKRYLYDGIFDQRIQVWLCAKENEIRFCLFTRIAALPEYSVLDMFWGAGEHMLEHVGPTLEAVLEEFAYTHGCKEIQLTGRRGWEKILKKWGFRHLVTIWSRPVLDRRAN